MQIYLAEPKRLGCGGGMETKHITNKLLAVLSAGECLTDEANEYGIEIITDAPRNGELRISWVANVSAPSGTVGAVLADLASEYSLRLTAMGGSQAEYYQSIGFTRDGRDMVLAKGGAS